MNRNLFNIAIRFLTEVVTRLGSLVVFPLMAAHVGPEGYGIYTQIGTINGVLTSIATIGLGFSVVRLVTGKQNVPVTSARFWSSLMLVSATSSALALLVIVTAPLLNFLFIKTGGAESIIRWSTPLIWCAAIGVSVGEYFRSLFRGTAYSLFQILSTIATVGGVSIVFTLGGELIDIIKILIAIQIVQIVLMVAYLIAVGEVHVRARLMPLTEVLEMIRFGTPILIMSISTWAFASGDRLIIGAFLSTRDVGVYSAACIVAMIPSALASPFWYVLYPLMATCKKYDDSKSLALTCRTYSRMYFVVAIPALLGLTILSPDIVLILSSGKFVIDPLMFFIIATALFTDQFVATSHYLIYLYGDPRFLRNVSIVAGLISIAMNFLLVPLLGLMGAALSMFVSYCVLEAAILQKAMSYGFDFNKLYDLGSIGRIAISAIFMVVVVYELRGMLKLSFGFEWEL